MSTVVQRHLSNDERRVMDLALRQSVAIIEDPRDAEILRLRAQVAVKDAQIAALLKVKEAVYWAVGLRDDFRPQEDGEGAFWWRHELMERAGLSWKEKETAK